MYRRRLDASRSLQVRFHMFQGHPKTGAINLLFIICLVREEIPEGGQEMITSRDKLCTMATLFCALLQIVDAPETRQLFYQMAPKVALFTFPVAHCSSFHIR